MPTVGSIVNGAFRLVRDHPVAVAIWGLIYLVIGVAANFAMRPVFAMQIAAMDGKAPPAEAFGQMWSWLRWVGLLGLISFLVYMVIFTATQRAVLRPQDEGVAFLRFGMDELRMIGLAILLVILFYVGLLIVFVALGAVIGVSMVSAGQGAAGGGAAVGAVLLGFLAVIALFCVSIWLYVRLSLAFPLTFLRRRIVIGEAWRLSRGRFWSLFGAYVALFLIVLVLSSIVSSIGASSYFGDLMQGGFQPERMMEAAQRQAQRMAELNPITILMLVLNAAVSALMVALLGGAQATAVRELTGDDLLAREFS